METNLSPTKKLSIATVLFEAGWHIWKMRKDVVIAICLPALLSIAAELWVFTHKENQFIRWMASLLTGFLWCLAAVTCHRLILLGRGSVPMLGVNGSQLREWRFFGRIVCIAVIYCLLTVLVTSMLLLAGVSFQSGKTQALSFFQMAITSLQFLMLVPLLAFVASLLLVLPATALDLKLGFYEAFQLAKGNRLRMTLIVYGLPLLLGVGIEAVVRGFSQPMTMLLDQFLYWIVLPFEIAILSVCYQKLTTNLE